MIPTYLNAAPIRATAVTCGAAAQALSEQPGNNRRERDRVGNPASWSRSRHQQRAQADRATPASPAGLARNPLPRRCPFLLKIYAHCIDGQADAANQRIADALSDAAPPEDEVSGE